MYSMSLSPDRTWDSSHTSGCSVVKSQGSVCVCSFKFIGFHPHISGCSALTDSVRDSVRDSGDS